MITAIVTVRLPKHTFHNPKVKVEDNCPLYTNVTCTDVTGEHHSFLAHGNTIEEIRLEVKKNYEHITRIEVVRG